MRDLLSNDKNLPPEVAWLFGLCIGYIIKLESELHGVKSGELRGVKHDIHWRQP